jgi:hypothetical protein
MKKFGGTMSEQKEREGGDFTSRPSNLSRTRKMHDKGSNWNFVMLIGAVVFSFIICASFVAAGDSTPTLPDRFYGTVTINDQPAPVGTLITAVVQGGGGSFTTTQEGVYGSTLGSEPKLLVQGTDDSIGMPVSFFVNGLPAECYPVATGGPWQDTYPFQPDGNINLNLRAYGQIWTISAYAGAGGSISPMGEVQVPDDEDQAFSIVPDECYQIDDVLVDGSSVGAVSSYTFYDVEENHTIYASFEPIFYTLSGTAGAGGHISPEGDVTVPCGGSLNFTVTPDTCYSIADVLVNGYSVGPLPVVSFTDIHQDYSIEAIFAPTVYTISASADEGGTINPSGTVPVACGDNVVFTITPDSCHIIADVLVNGTSVGAVPFYTFYDVDSDHTISAEFEVITYTIVASAGEGGSISPSGEVEFPCGSDQTFTITPDGCYRISNVLVDGNSVGAVSTYTFYDLDDDHTISAEFTPVLFTISSSSGPGGSISPSGGGEYPCGSDQTFTITPDGCYRISNVLVDGESIGAVDSYTFYDLDDDHTITAEFSQITYTIEATAGPGGSIVPEGTIQAPCGSSRLFLITPESGFHIDYVVVDNVSQGAVSSYTFNSIHENHTIDAYFAEGGPVFFTETLCSGWNLFSTPILLESGYNNIDEIFAPDQLENIDMILAWSGSYWFIPGEEYQLDPLYAIYVKVHTDECATAIIYPSTSVSSLPARYLDSGLSLIGSAPAYDGSPFPAMPVDQALISIREAPGNLTGYTMVISPGLGQPAWVYVQGAPVQSVLPFKGYWVVMENPDTLFGFSTTPIA